MDLVDGEDVGELGLWRHAQVLERLPVARRGAAEGELERAVGNRERAAREAALVLQVGEPVADLRFREGVGRLAAVLDESGEPEILEEALAKSGRRGVVSERGVSERA